MEMWESSEKDWRDTQREFSYDAKQVGNGNFGYTRYEKRYKT